MKRKKTKKQIKIRKINKKQIKKNSLKLEKNNLQKTFFEKLPARYIVWIFTGFVFVIGFFAFGKYLTGEYLFFFKDIGSDSVNQNIPIINQKILMLKEGLITKWTFYAGMGEKNVSVFPVEPYGFLRSFIQVIGMKIFGADFFISGRFIQIFIYNFLISGIVFFFYLRTISINKFSSFVGALLLSFSGYMVVGSSWGFSEHIFKAVFLLFAFEQLLIKKRWYFFIFALIFLTSNIFVLYIYSLFLFIYSIFRFSYEKKGNSFAFLKFTGKMIMLGIFGLLMSINRLAAEFLKMFFSPRVAGNASYSQSLSGGEEIIEQSSLATTTLLRFFSSDILGTGSNFQGWTNYFEAPLFYIGLLTILFFPQVFIHLNKRNKIIFASFLGFWLLTLFIPYLRHAFLAFTGDYFRYGFDFFIPFTLLFFSVFALNKLDKNFKLNLPLLVGTFFVLLVILFFPYNSISITAIDTDLRKIIVLLLIFYSVLIFFMSKPKYKSFAQIGIIFLLIFELSYFSYKSYKERVPVTKTEFAENSGGYKDGTKKAVEYIKSIDKNHFYRTEKDYQSGNAVHGSLNDAQAQGYYGTASYSSFNQLNYIRFLEETEIIQKGDETATRWVTGFRGNPLLQTFGNVKYHLSKNEKPEFMRFGFDFVNRKSGITILKNRFYLPFGYTYDKYIKSEDFKQLNTYIVTQKSLNNIKKEFAIIGKAKIGENIAKNMLKIINKEFSEKNNFIKEIETKIGKKFTNQVKLKILKHCTNNFSEQLLLLNGFVYEKNNQFDLNNFEQIKLGDSNVFIPAHKFNFEKYSEFVNNLKKDTLQINSFTNSKITGSIKLTKTKMLFFTIPYDEGWKIEINGKEKKLSRVNFGFTGIILPKGKHEIKLFYVPMYSQLTSYVSIISIILFWLFLIYYFYKKRKKLTKQ